MKILKIAFLKKICCLIFFMLSLSIISVSHAEIRLPKLAAPSIEVPEVPSVPSPQMPEIKGIDVDTDKISQEIDEHAKAARDKDNSEDKKDDDKDKTIDKNDKKSTAADKIKNNKYIRQNTDSSKNSAAAKTADAASADNTASADKKDSKSDNKETTAQQLLSADFVPVMFYVFSKTAFIGILLWLIILQAAKKLPVLVEALSFSFTNIIAGAAYFPLADRLETGKLSFYDKIISMNDFLAIMGVFAVCALLIAGIIGTLLLIWQKKQKRRTKW